MSGRVLMVDDDLSVREAIGQTLELGGYEVILAASFIEAKDHIVQGFPGVVISDIRMPGKDGFDLLAYVRSIDDALPVILLTGEGDVPTAVRGMQKGAHDFLEKPCEPAHLLEVVGKALRTRALVQENRKLKQDLDQALHEKIRFLGVSEASIQVRDAIRRAARAKTPVLISGEQGSGRGFVARLIEEESGGVAGVRRVNCISPLHLDFPADDDGALLLCDVERLTQQDQWRLVQHVKGFPDVRIFATTGRDPEAMTQIGSLTDELFYAFGVARIQVLPLNERPEDVPLLFDVFLRQEIDAGAPITSAAGRAAMQGLAGFDWQGNLRALRNHAKRVAWGLDRDLEAPDLKARLERVERGIIEDHLRRHSGQVTETAKALGMPRKTFYDRLQKLGIRAEKFRGS